MAGARADEFLQWALPRLGLSWPGFRRVRRQVTKRIARRLAELRLPDATAYRGFLETHPAEWATLDAFCRVTISRFFRDAAVFDALARQVLPCLAEAARAGGRGCLRAWSAGCASGEEPYGLNLAWRLRVASRFPDLSPAIVATDADEAVLARAKIACYRASSLKELPAGWRAVAFESAGRLFCLKPEFRNGVEFVAQDLRHAAPDGPFDLVLCRNVAFTYFDAAGQAATLGRLKATLRPGGALVIGRKERLPVGAQGLQPWIAGLGIYRQSDAADAADASAPAKATSASRRISSARSA